VEPIRKRARLLVVDDEADIRGLVVDALRRVGYSADEAEDGLKALDLLSAVRYDIVLTDLKMPGLGGLGLLARVKELYPGTDVIMFTGYATIRTSVEAMRSGAYDYLPKPFDPEDLVRSVQRCMERRSLMQERQRLSEVVSLLELGRTLAGNLDLDALAAEIVEQVARVFGADWVLLLLRQEAADALTLAAEWRAQSAGVEGRLEPTPEFLGRLVSRFPGEIVFGGGAEMLGLEGSEGGGPDSVMGIPLRTADRDIGVLICARCSGGLPKYGTGDGQLFSLFATQAAVSLDNALRYRELRSLDEIGRRLAATLDGDRLGQETLSAVMRLVRPDAAAICIWRPDDRPVRLRVALRPGLSQEVALWWRDRLCDEVWQALGSERDLDFEVHWVETGLSQERFRGLEAGQSQVELRSVLLNRMGGQEVPFGLLAVGSCDRDVFTEEHARAFSTLTSSVSVALSNVATYRELRELNIQTIVALVNTVEARDPYTRGHSEKVGRYAAAIARELGLAGIEVERAQVGGLLHDIGKVGISDAILYKPGQLTDDEHESMKEHPAIGARIVESIERLAPVVPAIYAHQERYDGSGYPEGLRGEEIPFIARIVAVADAFEAMTSERPYKPAMEPPEALRLLVEGAGGWWDPQVVDALVQVVQREAGRDGPA